MAVGIQALRYQERVWVVMKIYLATEFILQERESLIVVGCWNWLSAFFYLTKQRNHEDILSNMARRNQSEKRAR